MKTRLLIFGAFIVGAVGAAVVIALSIFCCEPHALAVVELDGAWIKGYSQTQDPQPFIDSVSDKNPNVVFRHNLKLVTTPSAQPTQPPELQDTKNIGTICINCRGNAIGGLHVTQRIGYNDIASLEATLNLLTTPTPPPSSNR